MNGWHNLVHLLSGVAALAVAGSRVYARLFAFGFGGVYVLVTILGLAAGDNSTLFGLGLVVIMLLVLGYALLTLHRNGGSYPGLCMATPPSTESCGQ